MVFTQLLKSFLAHRGFSEQCLHEDGMGATLEGDDSLVEIALSEQGDTVFLTGHLGPVAEDDTLRLRIYRGLMVLQGINVEKPHLSLAVTEVEDEEQVVLFLALPFTVDLDQVGFDNAVGEFLDDYEILNENLLVDLMLASPASTTDSPPLQPRTY